MKMMKGSLMVEAAYILPVIFLSFILGVYMLFYFHDKNILLGAGYETTIVGSQKMKWNEENIEEKMSKFFRDRVRGKMIFFSKPKVTVQCKNNILSVDATVKKRKVILKVHQEKEIKTPEKYIRKKRKIYGK
ncbi:TadE family protein [Faecalimonas sp.]